MTRIFISYSRVDRSFVDQVIQYLERVFEDVWFDKRLLGGQDWWKEILEQIKLCDVFIYLISRESVESTYCQAEFKEAQRLKKPILPICIRTQPVVIPEELRDLQIVDMIGGVTAENITELYAAVGNFMAHPSLPESPLSDAPTPMPDIRRRTEEIALTRPMLKLCERISQYHWQSLEQAAVRAVTAGGTAAMSLYRQPLEWPAGLGSPTRSEKNPSTSADLVATAAILQTIDAYLAPIAHRLICPLTYLGEETVYFDWLRQNLAQDICQRIHSPETFFNVTGNVMRVILDGLDGTGSFVRGMPLFCSAVAILIEDQVRVSAIYDPIHHVVYSASLEGPYENPDALARAQAWEIATGSRVDLVRRAAECQPKNLREEALGIHLTRSHPKKLHEFLDVSTPSPMSILERLASASANVYALNSGLVAMADVARGALGGFVNNITNLWDVASGEVLVRACGGKVTSFDGNPIGYSSLDQVSVVAARTEALHTDILYHLG